MILETTEKKLKVSGTDDILFSQFFFCFVISFPRETIRFKSGSPLKMSLQCWENFIPILSFVVICLSSVKSSREIIVIFVTDKEGPFINFMDLHKVEMSRYVEDLLKDHVHLQTLILLSYPTDLTKESKDVIRIREV